ncbi:uncharacterized protein LOC119781965 [Cyprinodon tularosa]|uniref:uncharacterized protein LOC119781965 n=1 Tax=Cyprinodon tularosa TaxID=77115 RepID=UPI0018E2048E|nr:uncharacterized protein LOC119781965 [Cyprinodon tularosa]
MIRYLGVWFDEKLSFKIHMQKIIDKCKKGINILKCLSGNDWGATSSSLKRIYDVLIRSVLDYGCIVYKSAANSLLLDLDRIQAKALRICSGAFRTSPVPALQVITGEMPLDLRRMKLSINYWLNLQGHEENHPTKQIFRECWEYGHNIRSFGWEGNIYAEYSGISNITYCKTVSTSKIAPWFFEMPIVNLETKKIEESCGGLYQIIQQHLEVRYENMTQIYTDASKEENGKTGVAVYIPKENISIKRRTTDNLSIFSAEMLAIILALQWVLEVKPRNVVICSDSMSCLTSFKSGKSESRQDLLDEVSYLMYGIRQQNISIQFTWVPAHKGILGNEKVDKLAKEAVKVGEIEYDVPLSRTEIKVIIKDKINKVWQKRWNLEKKRKTFI